MSNITANEQITYRAYYREIFSELCLLLSGSFFLFNLIAWPPIGSLHYIMAGIFVIGLLVAPKE